MWTYRGAPVPKCVGVYLYIIWICTARKAVSPRNIKHVSDVGWRGVKLRDDIAVVAVRVFRSYAVR